jgi:hypothetical protein
MDPFSRLIVGYHGCTEEFARDFLLGTKKVHEWLPSTNTWDWLGHGIYFWEHAPERAMRWATEKHGPGGGQPAVLGAVIQLGRCFDLLNEAVTAVLAEGFLGLLDTYVVQGKTLPENSGTERKRRDLDCMVINYSLDRLHEKEMEYDTVRGAFLEGQPTYPGAGFARETHIQVAVRNPSCILGVFRPNL